MKSNAKWIGLAILVIALTALMYWRLALTPAQPVTPESPAVDTAVATQDTPMAEPTPETEDAAAEPQRPRLRTLPGEAPAKEDAPTKDGKPKRVFTGTGVINVSVVGVDGKPAANANVMVERIDWEASERPPAEGVRHEDTTGADGAVSFDALPDGNYVVRAYTVNGMQSASTTLSKEDRVAHVLLELWEAAPVDGSVVNTAGEGIVGALVYVYETDRVTSGPLLSDRATQSRQVTDENGQFRFAALWKGKWRLYAQAESFAASVTDWFAVPSGSVQIVLGLPGTVSGTIVHEVTGERAPNVGVVALTEFARDQRQSASDEMGKFRIEGLTPGDIRLTVKDHEVVLMGAPVAAKVVEGQEAAGIELRVVPGGIIRGRVFDQDTGSGIPGATLSAYSRDDAPSRDDIVTGLDGVYEVRGLTEAVYDVTPLGAPGFSRKTVDSPRSVKVTPGQVYEGIDFSLHKGMSLSGRVVDQEGVVVTGAQVRGLGTTDSQFDSNTTDASGRFALNGFRPGDIEIEIMKEGYGRKLAGPFQIDVAGVEGIEIVLEAAAAIAGTVVDKENRPVASVPLYARTSGPVVLINNIKSQSTGAFRIPGLGAGNYTILMGRIGQDPWNGKEVETVTLRAGEVLEGLQLVYDFSGKGSVAGHVTDIGGTPIEGVSISGRVGGGRGNTRTDIDGYYLLEEIDDERVGLRAEHRHYSSVDFQATVGTEDNDFTMEGRGAIAGHVVDGNTDTPVRTFELAHLAGAGVVHRDANYTTLTDEAGEFLIEDVEVGGNTVFVRAEGFAIAVARIPSVRAGETVSGVEIRLFPAAAVEGIVVDKRGNPIAGAMVFDGPPPQVHMRERVAVTTTDAKGEFQIATMSPTATELWAYHVHYLDGAAAVSLASNVTTHVEIVLPDGGTLEGIVRQDGVPKEGVWIGIVEPEPPHLNRSMKSNGDGHYRVAGLAPGSLTVSASISLPGNASRTISKQAEFEEGMNTIVDFDFDGTDAAIEGQVTLAAEPITSAFVWFEKGSRIDNGESAITYTDNNGFYRFENISPGEASVTVYNKRGGSKRVKATLESGGVTRADINFASGQRVVTAISGFASAQDTRIALLSADARIEGRPTSQSYQRMLECCLVSGAQLGVDGTAVFEGIESGDYILFAINLDSSQAESETVYDNALFGHAEVTVREGEETAVELTIR